MKDFYLQLTLTGVGEIGPKSRSKSFCAKPRDRDEVEDANYVMRSKNEVLCAAAGRLPAARSEDNQPKHIKPFLLRITYTIFSSNRYNKLFKTC
jgi:hypothetical protein